MVYYCSDFFHRRFVFNSAPRLFLSQNSDKLVSVSFVRRIPLSNGPKILVSPPGPKATDYVKKDEKFVSPSYRRYYPLVVDSAKDCIVKDVDGNVVGLRQQS